MKRFVYEMAVYCGAMKVWRVLNINTGTIYSTNFETMRLAEDSIKEGEVRGSWTVKKVTLMDVFMGLDNL